MTDALDILKAARAKIAKPEDWGKGRRCYRSYSSCCAAEAIEECTIIDRSDVAYFAFVERRQAFHALTDAAGLESEWQALTNWNDAPERTHAEVLATFDLAIATQGQS